MGNDVHAAEAAINAANLSEARRILTPLIQATPNDHYLWFLMSCAHTPTIPTDRDKISYCLNRALVLKPDYEPAIKRVRYLFPERFPKADPIQPAQAAQPQPASTPPAQRPWIYSSKAKNLAFFLCFPAWAIIEIVDPQTSSATKGVAGVMLAFVLLFCFVTAILYPYIAPYILELL